MFGDLRDPLPSSGYNSNDNATITVGEPSNTYLVTVVRDQDQSEDRGSSSDEENDLAVPPRIDDLDEAAFVPKKDAEAYRRF